MGLAASVGEREKGRGLGWEFEREIKNRRRERNEATETKKRDEGRAIAEEKNLSLTISSSHDEPATRSHKPPPCSTVFFSMVFSTHVRHRPSFRRFRSRKLQQSGRVPSIISHSPIHEVQQVHRRPPLLGACGQRLMGAWNWRLK